MEKKRELLKKVGFTKNLLDATEKFKPFDNKVKFNPMPTHHFYISNSYTQLENINQQVCATTDLIFYPLE